MRCLKSVVFATFSLMLAGCDQDEAISFPKSEPPTATNTQAPTEEEINNLEEIKEDIAEVQNFDRQKLTVFTQLDSSEADPSVSSTRDLSISVQDENSFSNSDGAIGYVGSTLPVFVEYNNKTGSPVSIVMVTYFHSGCEANQTDEGTKASLITDRENAHYTNLYLPTRGGGRAVPIARAKSRGGKYISVQFLVKLENDELVNIPANRSLVCSPIDILLQPGGEIKPAVGTDV